MIIQPLAISRADGIVAPAAIVRTDGLIAPVCAIDGSADCCCGDGGCPTSDDPVCGEMTLAVDFISPGTPWFENCTNGGVVRYFVDEINVPEIFVKVAAGPLPPDNPYLLYGCRTGTIRVRVENPDGSTESYFSAIEVNYEVTAWCEAGQFYITQAYVRTSPPPVLGGLVFNAEVFFFDESDPSNPFSDPSHPSRFTRSPKAGDPIPNLVPPVRTTSSSCGPMESRPLAAGGTAAVPVVINADCPSDLCGEGTLVCPACDGSGDTYPVDVNTIPVWAQSFRVGTRRYAAQGLLTADAPLPVDEFFPTGCPGAQPDFMIATKCYAPATGIAPQEIVVAVNPGIGFGLGAVTLVALFPNPACPDAGDRCTLIARYRPTQIAHPGPATPGALHVNGTPCTLPDQVTCRACPVDGDGVDPIRNPNQQPVGNDPMAPMRQAHSCRGCGDPGLEGIL